MNIIKNVKAILNKMKHVVRLFSLATANSMKMLLCYE